MSTLTVAHPNSRPSFRSWLRPRQLGLEIGDAEARMVVVREQASGYAVLRAGQLSLSTPFVEAPQIAAAEIAAWLRREGGAQPGHLVATLPSACFEYESVPVSLEEVAGQQAATTAQHLMTELLGEELHQVSYDYWVNTSSAEARLQLAWAPREVLVQVAEGLSRSGWRISAFDLPVVAMARLGRLAEAPESQLIVELNPHEANYVWSNHGEPSYLRTRISLGNQSPVEIVAARRQISLATAETALLRWGLDHNTVPALAELHEACLNDWLERLSYEIHRTLQFIHNGLPVTTSPGVVLCGCGSDIRGLAEWLGKHLTAEVSVANLPDHNPWLSAQPYRSAYAIAFANSQYGACR